MTKCCPRHEVLDEVYDERTRQDEKWGVQHHPDGTHAAFESMAESAKEWNARLVAQGNITWLDILEEEVAEAFAETDPEKLRAELVQVAAVACCWVEDIDSRSAGS